MNVCKLVFALCLLTLISGCVLSADVSLNGQWGDRIDLSSKLLCYSSDSPESGSIYYLSEHRTKESPSKFRYTLLTPETEDAVRLVFKETEQASLYLMEMSAADQDSHSYFWYDEDSRTISTFTSTTSMEELMEKYSIEKTPGYSPDLEGSEENLRALISSLAGTPRDFTMVCLSTS